jgi:hypothetical protein
MPSRRSAHSGQSDRASEAAGVSVAGGTTSQPTCGTSTAFAVKVTTQKIAGVPTINIAHTEAAYLIDTTGHEHAVFAWPFYPQDSSGCSDSWRDPNGTFGCGPKAARCVPPIEMRYRPRAGCVEWEQGVAPVGSGPQEGDRLEVDAGLWAVHPAS